MSFDQAVVEADTEKFKTRKFRFHLLGVPYVPTHKKYGVCPFNQTMISLSRVLLEAGHEVYLYSSESSESPCTEFIQVLTLQDLRDGFGDPDYQGDSELGYDWKALGWRTNAANVTKTYNENCIREINARKKDTDFLLLSYGYPQKAISDAVKLRLTCEYSIGYIGCFAPYKNFKSTCIRNLIWGKMNPKNICKSPGFYDRTIPNLMDPNDFSFSEKRDDYFVFIGRLIFNKGLTIAYQVCQRLKKKLIIVGQGWKSWDPKTRLLVTNDAQKLVLPDYMEFLGYADLDLRRELLSKAKAVFTPSIYVEPFGNTPLEAQFSGAPVICTNYGGLVETVEQGITGFRCDTLNDFLIAAQKVDELDNKLIRQRAIERFSLNVIKYQYYKWFNDLYDLFFNGGWSNIRCGV